MKLPRWFGPAVLVLSAILLLGLFSTELADPDAWWHLATGTVYRHTASSARPRPVRLHDRDVSARECGRGDGAPFNLTHEWLAQAVWYLIEAAGGAGAVVLWKALLLTTFCGLVGLVTYRRTVAGLGVAASLATASLAVEFAHTVQHSVVRFHRAVRAIGGSAAAVVPRHHAGVGQLARRILFGMDVCGAYAAERFCGAPPMRNGSCWPAGGRADLGRNPNGFAVLPTLLEYRQSALQSTLIEWSPRRPVRAAMALRHSALRRRVVLLFARKCVRPVDWILFAAFAARRWWRSATKF